ncbi:MAG TPA: hypothetical protein VIL19_09480 [Casimicrobiaceae bacterium]
MTTQKPDSRGGAGGKPSERKPAVKEPGSNSPAVQLGASAQKPDAQRQQAAQGVRGEYGEGNYKATRVYNEGLKHHLETHNVEKEARDAAPASAKEVGDMERAEEKGRARARGEDPEVNNA